MIMHAGGDITSLVKTQSLSGNKDYPTTAPSTLITML